MLRQPGHSHPRAEVRHQSCGLNQGCPPHRRPCPNPNQRQPARRVEGRFLRDPARPALGSVCTRAVLEARDHTGATSPNPCTPHTRVGTQALTPTYTHVRIHTHIHTHTHTRVCLCTHMCTYTQVHSHPHTHIYTGVHTLTQSCPVSLSGLNTKGKQYRAGSSQGVIYFNY